MPFVTNWHFSISSGGKAQPQGAIVALDPRTGQVLAMVGGRSYEDSQLNRATDAKRQPGSVFKPFVYAAAFEGGISPLSTYRDAPQTFRYDHATYSPANYGRAYSMHDILLREGLIRSLNVVTVDVAMRTGLSRVAATALDSDYLSQMRIRQWRLGLLRRHLFNWRRRIPLSQTAEQCSIPPS